MELKHALTIDIDWAPDFAIRKLSSLLIQYKVKCTWFVTHESPAVNELNNYPQLFELGIHPNFFAGSTHGNNEKEVIEHVLKIVPKSKSVRSHALVQSSRLLNLMNKTYGIQTDCSILLYMTQGISAHSIKLSHDSPGLIRIPFFWEDDIAMYDQIPLWDPTNEKFHQDGLKVFNFHPTFVYLNGNSMAPYEEMKKIKHLSSMTEQDMDPFIHKGEGCGTFFEKLLALLDRKKLETFTMSEFSEQYNK
jgi:hypothetical protein